MDYAGKSSIDFSDKAYQGGKFFRPDADLRLPIYLNPDVEADLAKRVAHKGMPLGKLVNAVLKQESTLSNRPSRA